MYVHDGVGPGVMVLGTLLVGVHAGLSLLSFLFFTGFPLQS